MTPQRGTVARRRFGALLLESEGDGRWRAVGYPNMLVERDDDFLTECENPHPGCPGNNQHTYTRWGVWDEFTNDFAARTGPGEFATFTDAAEWLAREIEK